MDEKHSVVIIGGGITGISIARDLALRGVSDILLLEKDALASGASGRNHGLLHSGARYVVKDPLSARECAQENKILRKIAPHLIEDTGGLFISLPQDPPSYVDEFIRGCKNTGVEFEELSISEALKLEPNLNPEILRVFHVNDASIDAFQLALLTAYDASINGASIRPFSKVIDIIKDGMDVIGVKVYDSLRRRTYTIRSEIVINATNAWANKVTKLIGIQLPIILDRGTLIVFSRRILNTVVNRLRPPSDGDILVPHHTTSIMGTTSISIDDPEKLLPSSEEIFSMVKAAVEITPEARSSRIIRAYAGPRALLSMGANNSSRELPRSYRIFDHEIENGVSGFISIVGGKLTTARLMAEKLVDVVLKKLGIRAPCPTHKESLPGADRDINYEDLAKKMKISNAAAMRIISRWGGMVREIINYANGEGTIVCSCESVHVAELRFAIEKLWAMNIDDLTKRCRAGMGPCQAMNCVYRLASILRQSNNFSADYILDYFIHFLRRRWRGEYPVMFSHQERQCILKLAIYCCLGNFDKLLKEYEVLPSAKRI